MKRSAAFLLSTALSLCVTLPLSTVTHAEHDDRLQRASLSLDASALSSLLLLDVAYAGARLVAVGEQGTILLSDDNGRQWRQARTSSSVLLTAVSFANGQQGWAVGHDGILLHSADGGESWGQQLDGNRINQLRIDALNRALEALDPAAPDYAAQEEQLSYALDDATVAVEEGASTPLLDLLFISPTQGYAVGAYGTFLRTLDGGESWESMDHRLPNPDRFHLNAMMQSRDGTLYMAGEAGLLMRSVDQGDHWTLLDTGYDGSFFALQEAQQLYVMGLRGHLFSSEEGSVWSAVDLPSASTLSSALRDARGGLLLLGQGGLVLQQRADGRFERMPAETRTGFSAGVRAGDDLILVGESGVTLLPLAADEGGRS